MKTAHGLKIIIFLYLFCVLSSPLIYFFVSKFVEIGFQSMAVTGAIAYIIFSTGVYCLLKKGFEYEPFQIIYLLFLNIFPFVLFYALGVGMIDYTARTITGIINFMS